MTNILKNITALMAAKGISARDLSVKASIDASALANLPQQNPDHPITAEQLGRISDALDVPAWALAVNDTSKLNRSLSQYDQS